MNHVLQVLWVLCRKHRKFSVLFPAFFFPLFYSCLCRTISTPYLVHVDLIFFTLLKFFFVWGPLKHIKTSIFFRLKSSQVILKKVLIIFVFKFDLFEFGIFFERSPGLRRFNLENCFLQVLTQNIPILILRENGKFGFTVILMHKIITTFGKIKSLIIHKDSLLL